LNGLAGVSVGANSEIMRREVGCFVGRFSSIDLLCFPILVSFDFGTDEIAAPPTQALELQGTFSSRLPRWTTPLLLPQTRLPQGQGTRDPDGLVALWHK
jgi:hypothetical protein